MFNRTVRRLDRRAYRHTLGSAFVLALACSAPFAATPAVAADKPAAAAPKVSLSNGFKPLYANMAKAIETAKARPDVVAARANVTSAQAALQQARGPARTQAQANLDAATSALGALLTAEKGQLDALFAAATTPDDRYGAGSLAIPMGDLMKDTRVQRRGLEAMIASGKANPADVPRLQYYVGQFAFDQKDYAAARTAIQASIAGGFTENDLDGLLAESYFAENMNAQGLTVLRQAITRRNATPSKAPESWYRRGLGVAYKAQLLDQAVSFSTDLVQAYPSSANWAGAIAVVREVGKFAPQETLDLMRLMGRSNTYAEERDYIEYIQAADARRLPGEVLKVIDAGIAAGKLKANDPFIVDARTTASGRIATDRASLPGLERDARASAASGVTVSGAADALLSYGETAKAQELYNIALTKPGADTPRLLTRIGIAQYDLGDYAGAQATFAKVTGPRQSIARLWSLYAASKARPAA